MAAVKGTGENTDVTEKPRRSGETTRTRCTKTSGKRTRRRCKRKAREKAWATRESKGHLPLSEAADASRSCTCGSTVRAADRWRSKSGVRARRRAGTLQILGLLSFLACWCHTPRKAQQPHWAHGTEPSYDTIGAHGALIGIRGNSEPPCGPYAGTHQHVGMRKRRRRRTRIVAPCGGVPFVAGMSGERRVNGGFRGVRVGEAKVPGPYTVGGASSSGIWYRMHLARLKQKTPSRCSNQT